MMQINKLPQPSVGADLSRTPPIYRPLLAIPMNLLNRIIGLCWLFQYPA